MCNVGLTLSHIYSWGWENYSHVCTVSLYGDSIDINFLVSGRCSAGAAVALLVRPLLCWSRRCSAGLDVALLVDTCIIPAVASRASEALKTKLFLSYMTDN